MVTHVIEPEMLQRLGYIITKWAHVEALEAEVLSHLLDADPGGMYVMTQSVSGNTLTDWIRTLVPIRFSAHETRSRIAALLADIDQTRAERNALTHGLWYRDAEPGTVSVQTVRWERAEVIKHELWSTADLDELAERIVHIIGALIDLETRIKKILGRE